MRSGLYVIIGLIIFLFIGINIGDGLIRSDVEVRVEKLVNQQLIKGGEGSSVRTEIRYLVITDGGTFICENAVLQLKFNNSDIFFHLVEGKRYRLKLVGFGKTFFTDYKNIIGVELID